MTDKEIPSEFCHRCKTYQLNNSPHSYTWWYVKDMGFMCWKCHEEWSKRAKRNDVVAGLSARGMH